MKFKPFVVATINVFGEKWSLEPMFVLAESKRQAEELAKKSVQVTLGDQFETLASAREVHPDTIKQCYEMMPRLIV